MDSNSQRRWVDSILSKEEAEALYLSKKEAMIKRERIKDYSFSHRVNSFALCSSDIYFSNLGSTTEFSTGNFFQKSAESERNKVNGRWRYWLDEWVDTQVTKSRELEDLDSVPTSNPRPGLTVEDFGRRQLKLRNIQVQKNFEGLDSPLSISRRSFHHRRQCSLGDHNSLSSSPFGPAYMAATASAKAKSRSMSSPKMRTSSFETCSESYSPCKNKLSLISPMTTEMPTRGRIGKTNGYQQRSPSLKGLAGPIKSGRTAKDLSFDSEYSMQIWHQNDGFR